MSTLSLQSTQSTSVYTRLPRSGKLMVAHAAAKQIIPNRGQEVVVGNVPAKGAGCRDIRADIFHRHSMFNDRTAVQAVQANCGQKVGHNMTQPFEAMVKLIPNLGRFSQTKFWISCKIWKPCDIRPWRNSKHEGLKTSTLKRDHVFLPFQSKIDEIYKNWEILSWDHSRVS